MKIPKGFREEFFPPLETVRTQVRRAKGCSKAQFALAKATSWNEFLRQARLWGLTDWVFWYVTNIVRGRCPEAEPILHGIPIYLEDYRRRFQLSMPLLSTFEQVAAWRAKHPGFRWKFRGTAIPSKRKSRQKRAG